MRPVPFYAKAVPFYDPEGRQIGETALPEAIRPSFQRRGGFSDSGFYYKGAGIFYAGHLADRLLPGMVKTGETSCVYQKYQVIYPALYGRYGIFTFRHQPVFRDFEGGCGPKERNLVGMQKRFFYSAIDGEIEVLPTLDRDHHIYRYRLKERQGSYRDTARLLEYVLTENFNCPWDKNIWGDLYAYGYIRDLADWFVSEKGHHKLGTAYAFLSSIYAADRYLYFYLAKTLTGWEQLEPAYIPFLAARVVQKFRPDCMEEYDLEELSAELYGQLLNALYDGRACCHLEDEISGERFRGTFKEAIPGKTQAMGQLLRWRKPE